MPNIYILDNEFSDEIKTVLRRVEFQYQLVPPHTHRNNIAERKVQTYKSHLNAGLATVDPDYPLAEWDILIAQTNLTLNLLCSSRSNPKLSVWAYLFDQFDFRATPLAPPGTKVVSYKSVDEQGG